MKRWTEWIWGEAEGDGRQLIQIYGGGALYMEGCERILHCDEKRICLQGLQRVTVLGQELILKELGNRNVCASGRIEQILFGGEG